MLKLKKSLSKFYSPSLHYLAAYRINNIIVAKALELMHKERLSFGEIIAKIIENK